MLFPVPVSIECATSPECFAMADRAAGESVPAVCHVAGSPLTSARMRSRSAVREADTTQWYWSAESLDVRWFESTAVHQMAPLLSHLAYAIALAKKPSQPSCRMMLKRS